MSNRTHKNNLFKKNVLNRYSWDDEEGNKILNDFLQMSQIAEQLKDSNLRAFTVFMSLLKDKVELEEECFDRGKRIALLGHVPRDNQGKVIRNTKGEKE